MSYIAAVLIIISAIMHASWNFVSKRRSPSLAFFFISSFSAAVVMSPLLIFHRHTLSLIPISVWMLVLATGVAQMVYFFGLAGAYKFGDLSLAYPLARALPVLLVVSISLMLGKRADISAIGLIGMGLIIAGCVILPMPRFQKIQLRNYFDVVYLMAFIAAIGTTGYTFIDDQALRQLRDASTIQLSDNEVTLLFISLQSTSTALMLGLAATLYRPERDRLLDVFHNPALITTGVVTGVIILATYGLVLASMAHVTNVSYVAAFRQLSIPIGALLGVMLQQEPRYLPKLWGIGIVSVGLVLVGIG